jgi:hypothetical protein
VPRTGPVGGIACFLVALAATGGCHDELIHLGNGRQPADGGCPHAQVSASEVLWIGDSWVLMPGSQRTRVRDLARLANAIGPSEDYVNAAAPATTMSAIANQYNAREAGATKVKVLLMDGGTWDTIQGNGSDASVTTAWSAFTQFLAKVASDGTVADIVYFLPPELSGIPGVAALRPRVQQACTDSTVPCQFLDLQLVWAGHPEYTAPGDVFASDAGAQALADAMWGIMQANCVAQ